MQSGLVKAFFDRLADSYAERYSTARPFHQRLFAPRLETAMAGRDFNRKTILDIGAGTGPAYDYLLAHHRDFNYYACDISEKMLAQSSIPEERRFSGKAEEIDFPVEKFDYILALGLTTYLTRKGLLRLLAFLQSRLASQGQAILSFTYAHSLEWQVRCRLRPLFRHLGFHAYLISQPFEIHAYTPGLVQQLLPPGLFVAKTHWLSPTLPLFSRIFPRFVAPLANALSPFCRNKLYSDFLVEIEGRGLPK